MPEDPAVAEADPSGTIAAGPPPVAPAPPKRRRWLRAVGTSLLALLAVAAVAGLFIHLPYRIITPGSATPLGQEVVSVKGAQTYPHTGTHSGELLFLGLTSM